MLQIIQTVVLSMVISLMGLFGALGVTHALSNKKTHEQVFSHEPATVGAWVNSEAK